MNDPNDLHKPMPPPPPLISAVHSAPAQCCGDAPVTKVCSENGTESKHTPAGLVAAKPLLYVNNDFNCSSSPNFNCKATKSLPTTPSASLLLPSLGDESLVPKNFSENGCSEAAATSCLSSAQKQPPPTPAASHAVATSASGEEKELDSGEPAVTTRTAEFEDPDKQLLLWEDMPQHLQFNPYVLTGYRPLQTFKGCMCSLFYMHNETINILTHGIPIVYILATVPGMMPWETEFRFLSWCHLLGSVAPWCGSFVYHLFMNWERGERIYYKLLQLDMLGIWISQSFGALPMITATVFCWRLKWVVIIAYSLLCVWGLYKAMTAASPWERRLCFLMPFCMRVILTVFRILRLGGGNPSSLPHVFLQDGISIFGGAIGAMHIPEKWFPGTVDYYLNSHNIMHILVVLAVYSMHQATVQDIDWMTKVDCSSYNATATQSHQHIEL